MKKKKSNILKINSLKKKIYFSEVKAIIIELIENMLSYKNWKDRSEFFELVPFVYFRKSHVSSIHCKSLAPPIHSITTRILLIY